MARAKRTTQANAEGQAQGVSVADGLANVYTGMGGLAGSRRAGDVWTFTRLTDADLRAMYRSDWIARKAVEIPADDMTQMWRRWQDMPERVTALEEAERQLGVIDKVRTALRYARLYGGGALLLSDGAADPSRPFDATRLRKGGLKYIMPVPRTQIAADGEISFDPGSEHFGLPEFWRLARGPQVRIHHSRVIVLRGNPYPDPFEEADPWGDSILQAIERAVRDCAIANSAGAELLDEAKVDVVTMENLETHLQNNDANARLVQRMALMKLGKSAYKVMLLGGKEKFDTKHASFSNLEAVMFYYMQVVSGATDIPVTRFLAQSPAGLSSTGDSDLRNYAIMIRAQQERVLQPALARLDDALIRHALGSRSPELWAEWISIWQQSPKEAAETAKLQADMDSTYAMSGLVPSAALERAVQARMIESGQYPGLERALAEEPEESEFSIEPEPAPEPEPAQAAA